MKLWCRNHHISGSKLISEGIDHLQLIVSRVKVDKRSWNSCSLSERPRDDLIPNVSLKEDNLRAPRRWGETFKALRSFEENCSFQSQHTMCFSNLCMLVTKGCMREFKNPQSKKKPNKKASECQMYRLQANLFVTDEKKKHILLIFTMRMIKNNQQ